MSLPAASNSRWISWRISLGLAAVGGLVGAGVGPGLTVLGKVVAGAPAAALANYVWNAAVFGSLGALFALAVTWASLRHVPPRTRELPPVYHD